MPTNKQSGLGANFYVGGYDLSLDASSIDQIGAPVATLDATGIKQLANARLYGLHDADWQFTSFLDTASSGPQAPWLNNLHTLPRTDQVANLFLAQPPGYVQSVGEPAAGIIGIQINYDPTRDSTGNLTFKAEVQNDGHGMDWGVALTPGIRTDTTATQGQTYDGGAGYSTPPMIPSATSVLNPSTLPASVVITGGTISSVIVNGVQVGTGAGTYPVPAGQFISIIYTVAPTWTWTWTFTTPTIVSGSPVQNIAQLPASVVVSGGTVTNVQVGPLNNLAQVGTGPGTYVVPPGQYIQLTYTGTPAWTWTLQSAFGIHGYLQVFAFTGTSFDPVIQHSTDGVTFTTLLDFGSQSAIGALRSAVSGTVNRYIRVTTSGTFSNAQFAVMMNPNIFSAGF